MLEQDIGFSLDCQIDNPDSVGRHHSTMCLLGGECHATAILSAQDGFRSTRSCLQEIVEDAGHIFLLYPKFHCELEYHRSSCKHFVRKHCNHTLAGKLRPGVRKWRGTQC